MKTKASPIPHSWPIEEWPAHVFPNKPTAGRHIVRKHRDELLAMGALTRVGRQLVIFGEGYGRFLARKIDKVAGYQIAPNVDKSA